MSNMQSEVFEAFRAISVPEEKALKAATALSKRDEEVASIKTDTVVLKWMVGTLAAVMFGIGAPIRSGYSCASLSRLEQSDEPCSPRVRG